MGINNSTSNNSTSNSTNASSTLPDTEAAAVPEPSSIPFLLAGLLTVGLKLWFQPNRIKI
ncbi:PEP-CTERM sorting domain-containing protein [Coleofasciculus sp. E1-EBD-02]|uniref:PEP-CTERM sorting domain-containing protein n=1 Tax=Coleofasciculus sp. E1-EBD-02 TaxID=3068481 RepID=UPI004063B92E